MHELKITPENIEEIMGRLLTEGMTIKSAQLAIITQLLYQNGMPPPYSEPYIQYVARWISQVESESKKLKQLKEIING